MIEGKYIGLVGGGNMAEAIIKGLILSKICYPDQLLVSDIRPERLDYLKNKYGVQVFKENDVMVSKSDIVILAVKPQDIETAISEFRDALKDGTLIISIAAGIDTAFLRQCLAKEIPIIRVMPNTAALALASMSVISKGPYATDRHLEMAETLFKAIGETLVLPEKMIDAVTALSGSGPAYVCLFIEGLADGGVKMGLSREVALKLAIQTVFGTGKLLKEIGEHPTILKEMVASPGGTTIFGLHALENAGIKGALILAVEEATRRSRALGRK